MFSGEIFDPGSSAELRGQTFLPCRQYVIANGRIVTCKSDERASCAVGHWLGGSFMTRAFTC